jgi:putative nucleotidyltransferase with HDIG domain
MATRGVGKRDRHARGDDPMLRGVIAALTGLIAARDPYTAGHLSRVASFAERIAQRLGAPSGTISAVRIAGALHDVGKNGLSNALLALESALTPDQRRLIDEHVAIAVRALGELPLPRQVLTAIAQHHERLDGSGYPHGLAGDEISAEARILAVADTVEAMLHARPYRPAYAPEAVVHELMTARARKLDAAAVDAALALLR